MKQNPNRRSSIFRLDDGSTRFPSTLFWVLLHCLGCLVSFVLGFRFSRLVFFLLFSPTSTTNSPTATTFITAPFFSSSFDDMAGESPTTNGTAVIPASRVVVGRHGIRIRPWPHPNPEEVMRAHRILEMVQKEQRLQYGVKESRSLIVVTPTYVRTFQALHFTGVMHSLMNAPYDVIWIVVEAGGVSDETAALINKSGLRTIHIGFDQQMPTTWADRQKTEDLMRLQALKLIRDQRLDGILMFADDSNLHSMELFDEAQRVQWVEALSVGILLQTDGSENESSSLGVQGPAYNSSENSVGWRTFDTKPYEGKRAVNIGDVGAVLPRKMEWAGLVINSRLLWRDDGDEPEWIKDLDGLGEEGLENPLSLLKNPDVVEPLGNCGRKVLVWWLRVEARPDSEFPPRWVIDTPLEITVPAKHTPWSETSELPSKEKDFVAENTERQHPKFQSSRKRSYGSKKKHEARGA